MACGVEIVIGLVPDEQLASIFAGEAGYRTLAVLMNPLREVAGRTDVDCPVAPACHDVHVTRLGHDPLQFPGEGRGPVLTSAPLGPGPFDCLQGRRSGHASPGNLLILLAA